LLLFRRERSAIALNDAANLAIPSLNAFLDYVLARFNVFFFEHPMGMVGSIRAKLVFYDFPDQFLSRNVAGG
jgi:hypothetical protein